MMVNISDWIGPELEEEFSRSHVQVDAEFPDLKPLLSQLSQIEEWTGREESTPRLIIIHASSYEGLEEVRRLQRFFSYHPALVLAPAGLDASRLVDGNDESRFQVVSLPLHPDDLQAALHALAESFGGSGHRVVAVWGVPGGAGPTPLPFDPAH